MTLIALALSVGLFSIAGCSGDSSTGPNAEDKGGAAATNDATTPASTDDATADSSAGAGDIAANKSSSDSGGLSIDSVEMPDLDLDAKPKKGGIGSDVELTIDDPSGSSVDDIFGSIDDEAGAGTTAKKEPTEPATTKPDATEPAQPGPAIPDPAAKPDSGASVGSDPFDVAPAAAKPEMRTWTNAAGTFKTEAVFVEFKDGQVHLTKKDGKPAKIPLTGLSEADQQYVQQIVKALEGSGSEESPE
jgi:hypothetical protein